jgi:predicted ATPase
MYIEKATIENIKSIKYLEITFPKPAGWHVIIGDNGSGKSSILKAIALALIGPHEVGALRLNLGNYINYNEKKAKIELTLDLEKQELKRLLRLKQEEIIDKNKVFKISVKIEKDIENDFIQIKAINLKTDARLKQYIWSNRSSSHLYSSSFGPFRRFSGGNREWEKVFYSNPKTSNHLSIFGEGVALTESIEWLVQLNYKKLEGDFLATRALTFLENFINESNLLPHGAKITEINSDGVFFMDAYNEKVNIIEMSDGFRSVLSMTFEIIRQISRSFGTNIFSQVESNILLVEGIILIDEIDAHLHPTWQTKIGNWFTKHFPNIQFIVTTHSPLICRAAENGSIWQLAEPGSNDRIKEITGLEKERLISGNILDAYGTELFGQSPVRSAQSDEKLARLGELNMLYALGKINETEAKERLVLQKILTTDDPTGF